MPDITMCTGTKCPVRERCFRYKAVPDAEWQSFADFSFTAKKDVKDGRVRWECPAYLPIYKNGTK